MCTPSSESIMGFGRELFDQLPTDEPADGILPALSTEAMRKLEAATSELRRWRNLGTHLFSGAWAVYANDPRAEEVAPSLSVFRRFLHHLSGFIDLAELGWLESAVATQRVVLESGMSLEFLLGGDRARNAAAYVVWEWNCFLENVERFDGEKRKGEELKKFFDASNSLFDHSPLFRDGAYEEPEFADSRRDTEARMRANPLYAEALDAYGPKKPWYRCFNPTLNNLRDLAEHLGWTVFYELLYREGSRAIHSTDAMSSAWRLDPNDPEGRVSSTGLRNTSTEELESIVRPLTILCDLVIGRFAKNHIVENLDSEESA